MTESALNTDQIKTMFVGTLPELYQPWDEVKAAEFDAWLAAHDEAIRRGIAEQIRRHCTPGMDAYKAGGDKLIMAVADWVEHVPEWVPGIEAINGD